MPIHFSARNQSQARVKAVTLGAVMTEVVLVLADKSGTRFSHYQLFHPPLARSSVQRYRSWAE